MKVFAKRLVRALQTHFKRNHEIVGAEIGVYKGETSRALLENVPNLHLLMIDSYDPIEIGKVSRKKEHTADETLLIAKQNTDAFPDRRTIMVTTSSVAAEFVPEHSLDFVFIDANHSYEFVKQDIELWYPKLIRSTGLLMGHDYNSRLERKGKEAVGVKRAVDEFVAKKGLELRLMSGLLWMCSVTKT